SPYHAGKKKIREDLLKSHSINHQLFVGYINMVGGQDELVFDGNSMLLNTNGEIIAQANQFEEDLVFTDLKINEPKLDREKPLVTQHVINESIQLSDDLTQNKPVLKRNFPVQYDQIGEIYAALVLGTKDYVHKCGFQKVIVALSGGIDSSLVTTIAVDALGIQNVTAVSLPSKYSSQSSIDDAELLSRNLGITLHNIPIHSSVNVFDKTLESYLENIEDDLTHQNVQSRIRGLIMMALSNNSGALVLATGNKSEMAVGYATIYGDMAGGYAVIKDVPKTLVYKLASYRNSINEPLIPSSVLLKAPSAELKPNQKDQDYLPEYDVLDEILKEYIENENSPEEISEKGFPLELVEKIIKMVDQSEYKRQQAAPGIKITSKNFGRDRRMPISNRFRIN
ncbi:MAG: NAD+ synthase, partial [Nitrososphaerales archaeon]|nr:NAD+ synthase [Nitrososphaerales archaeon]